jgi:release factor glutamine methyltransferase
VGTDRSAAALAVARDNARRLGLAKRADMRLADWREPGWSNGLGPFDLIVANPPYVADSFELAPSVRDYEPAGALYAGPEGLDDYRILVPQLPTLLRPGGVAVLEIGATQAQAVAAIAAGVGFGSELHRDLAGRPRAFALRLGVV